MAETEMPVFTIKAKDLLATEAVQAYRALCTKYDLSEQAVQVQLALDEIRAWQRDHNDQVRIPHHRHVAACAGPDPAEPHTTWDLLPEPGPEVTRLKDRFGQYFNRQHHVCGPDLWIGTTFEDDPDIPDLELEWPQLMGHHAPLANATPADAATSPNVVSLTADDLLADPKRHGFETYYGVPVCSVGEDGDLLALGHHDPRRTIAAMNAYSRKAIGLRNLYDDHGGGTYSEAVDMLSARHAVRTGDDASPGSLPVMIWSA